jgi:hypothetical protein
VWNSVPHLRVITQVEGALKQGAERKIQTYGTGHSKKLEKITWR